MPRGSHPATLDFTNLTTEINHQRELVRKIQPPAKTAGHRLSGGDWVQIERARAVVHQIHLFTLT